MKRVFSLVVRGLDIRRVWRPRFCRRARAQTVVAGSLLEASGEHAIRATDGAARFWTFLQDRFVRVTSFAKGCTPITPVLFTSRLSDQPILQRLNRFRSSKNGARKKLTRRSAKNIVYVTSLGCSRLAVSGILPRSSYEGNLGSHSK